MAAPDDDKAGRRPPKATLVLVNDRVSAITEYKYVKKAGAWRVARSRTIFVDSTGAITLIAESDLSELAYRVGATRAGALNGGHSDSQSLQGSMLSIASPDMLRTASLQSGEEEACWQQIFAVIAANTAFLAAGASVTIAQAAESAARTASAAAITACVADPATCGAVPIAAAALVAAELGVTRAWALLVSAGAAVAAADAALSECLRPQPTDPGQGGGEEAPGCEEWCEWAVSFSGDRIEVNRNYCWCEYGDGAT